jgi:hypothetical protein
MINRVPARAAAGLLAAGLAAFTSAASATPLTGAIANAARSNVAHQAGLRDRNRFYIGEVVFRGQICPAEHPQILHRDLFEAVQVRVLTTKGGPPVVKEGDLEKI